MVATARVQGFRQIEGCTADQLRVTTAGYKLHDLDGYWASLDVKPSFFAVVVYLEDERWLDHVFTPIGRSHGESWIVLDRPDREREWLTEQDEMVRVANREHQEVGPGRRSGRGSRTISPSLRFEVFRRDAFTCQYCGRRAPEVVLHVDHVTPWARNGPTTLENLRTACSDCNLGKGARRLGSGVMAESRSH